MKETIYLFGVELFTTDGFYEETESGCQYEVVQWLLADMKEYDWHPVNLGSDGSIIIYDEDKEILNSWLLASKDFRIKLSEKLAEFDEKESN